MAGSLDDPWARKQRALEHLRTLQNEHGIKVAPSPLEGHPVHMKMHANGLEYGLHLCESVPTPEPIVSLLISECLFNLRSALDQLVYQLHVRRYRGNVPDDAEKESQFPLLINLKGRADDTRTWREIKRLGAKERAAIKTLQPYRRRNDHWQPTRDRLAVLSDLNNIDKHRRLYVARSLTVPVSKHNSFLPEWGFNQTVFARPLEADTEVERWTFAQVPTHMDVHNQVWSQVTFDDPSLNYRVNVNALLRRLIADVDEILRRFSHLFPDDPEWWQRRMK